jgi:N-methylhydantoinase A/oxoprolinase/acetone carboxylase beta subunit
VPPVELKLGLEVGGTNADAVAMSRRGRLLAKAKVPVTGDTAADLGAAMRAVMDDGSLEPARIACVMLGAHGHSSPLSQRELTRVGVLRIGAPLTEALPPLSTWPDALRTSVSAGTAVVRGGAEYDGRRAAPLDEDGIARFLGQVAGEADSIAITSVFSPVAPDQELAAAELVRRELGPLMHVSLSHEIGSIGLLERENATVLNGALISTVEALAAAVRDALAAQGLDAEPFVTQNDGTLMTLEHARRFPVLTMAAGPASGIRGAAGLSGVQDGVVVDAGGRRTSVGVLVRGFPREAAGPSQIAGVRVAFPMPDVRVLPFGGDSLADREALLLARDALAESVDGAKAELQAPPLVAVGGADALVPAGLPGVSEVIRPPDREVAGAVGAAMAPVSGHAECICSSHPDQREAALDELRASACAQAVHAGADPAEVTVVRVDEGPLTHLAGPVVRIRVRAAGPGGWPALRPRA